MTAGYMCAQPRAEFFGHIDAANVDLKGFTGDFYRRVCLAALDPVLETLLYLQARDRRLAGDHQPADPGPQRLRRRDRRA